MFHWMRWIIRGNVLLALVLSGSAFLGAGGPAAAQVPTPAVATLTGTAYRLVDQTIVDGVVVDETEVPITDGRIAIPELGIDIPLAADGSFELSELSASADPANPTEVTVIFTAPGLGSFTYVRLRIGVGLRPNLTPQLIQAPRVNDVVYHDAHSGNHQEAADDMGYGAAIGSLASGSICTASREPLVLPPTIRVWENGSGQDGLVHTVGFKFYAKHVLPREWDALWNDQSLLAGAMAVKSFAWWHATHAHHKPNPAGFCYDVDATENHQVFDPTLDDSATNAAVDATWDFYMIQGSYLNSDVLQAFYKAGYKNLPSDWDACGEWYNGGAPGDDMSQWGSHSCAQAGMPWYQILTTYYFPPLVSWGLLGASGDSDADGCTNGREAGTDELFGGRRNPLNRWDFYDVTGDRYVDLPNDILGVAFKYGLHTGQPGYNATYDRGPSAGPNPWNMTAPDGTIDLPNDVLGVAFQFQHNCQ